MNSRLVALDDLKFLELSCSGATLPKPGPPLVMFTTRSGNSIPAAYESPSCFRLNPGLEVAVIARSPPEAAPITMVVRGRS